MSTAYPPGPRPRCPHCRKNDVSPGRRGLCQRCARDPKVRRLYPPDADGKGSRRDLTDPAHPSAAARRAGGGRRRANLPDEPTDAPPGSEEKIRVMAERAALRQYLFHPLDARAGADDEEGEPWLPPGPRLRLIA